MKVEGFAAPNRKIAAVVTAAGPVEAAAVLVAAGARSGPLIDTLGGSLPVTAGKGYSLAFDDALVRVSRPLSLGGIKVACTPFKGGTRFGGTMELSGINERLDRRRLVAIRAGAARYFRAPLDHHAAAEWVGMRPVTPDGLPVMGPIPGFGNGFVATGHGMLGVTMAPLTGEAMADLMTGSVPASALAAFSPARFG